MYNIKKQVIIAYASVSVALIMASMSTASAELIHNFQSPAFIPGNGFSQHVLTIHQLEEAKKKEIRAEQQAAIAKAETAAKSTNLAKFLVNVEARIYAQLSKQLADQMFTEGTATSGSMDFQGSTISWVKSATDVTLTIIEATGGRTEITVPIASFAF
jgi:CO dehydrogenase/acetyl-CoA synthase beta subunit